MTRRVQHATQRDDWIPFRESRRRGPDDRYDVSGAFGSEAIGKRATDLGVATALVMIKSHDQAELRAALAQIPAPTGFARIDELGKVPVNSGRSLEEYKR